MVDFVPGGLSTTLSLATPGSVSGTIDAVDTYTGWADEDWYQVSLTAGSTYQFDMASAALDGVLKVYDSFGIQWAYADSGWTGDPESLSFSPTSSGSYYVSVSNWDGYTTGSFTLSASVTATGGAVDTVGDWHTDANVGTLAATGSVSGSIDNSYDSDWYAVQLTAGQNYLFSLSSTAPLDTSLSLYDANGWYQNSSWTYQSDESLFFSAPSTGTYYLAVYGDYTNTGSFTLTSSTATAGGGGADAIPDNVTTSATLAVGGSVNGTINSDTDYGDWYSVSLLGNTTYRFDLSAALMDGLLGLYDANGMYLSWADSGWTGDPEALVYTTTQAGTYYVGVSGYSGSGGDFQLGLSQLSTGGSTVDSVGGSSGAASFINIPGQVSGAIDSGTDADWYAVSLSANTLYQFDLSSFFIDGILTIYDANSIEQDYADNGLHVGDPESLYYTPTAAGTYYIAVSGYGDTTGSFQLDAIGYASQSGDFVADSASTTAAVAMPGTVWGVIDSANSTGGDDADWYSVRLNTGSTYRVDLSGAGTLDGMLTLYGTDGTSWLAGADAGYQGGSEYLYYSPTVTGNYYVAVDGWSDTTGEFWLSVAQTSGSSATTDTVGQTVGSSGSVALSSTGEGHVTGVIGDNVDADWYAVTLAANTQYEFNLGSLSLDGVLQLYDSSGTQLAYVDNAWSAGSENLVYATPATGGAYYIGVSGYGGSTGDFLLDIYSSGTVSNVDTVGDTYQTAAAGLLNIGGSAVRGQVDSGADEDVYSVALTANTAYLFDLSSTSLDGTLTLYGFAGEWLNSADYGGTGGAESLYFTPLTSGNYYISAGGWSSSTGSYDLSASAQATASGEVPGDITSTTNLPVPGFVDNQIGSAIDSDWFSIRMNQGNDYIFDLYSNDGLLDGILQIFDANGNTIYDQYGNEAYADNGWYAGDAEHLYFTATATGDYFIGVSSFGGTAGSYSLYSSEAVAAAAVDWADIASYTDIKWNVLDWVNWDTATWLAFDWDYVYADYINWNQLQYEHVYDATDPIAGYAGWNWDFTTTDPGNVQVIGGSANDTALLGIGLDYFSGGDGDDYADGGIGADNLTGGAGNDILDGGSGHDILAGGAGNDTYYVDSTGDSVTETTNVSGSATLGFRLALDLSGSVDKVIASISYTLGSNLENLDLAAGGGNLTGTGNELDNVLTGNEGSNTLAGGAGNDTLTGGAGNDSLDGGAGLDIASYSLSRVSFTVTASGTGFTVADTTGANGTDTLSNVERISFADGSLGLDISGTSGQMYRLYKAAFNRIPDAPGLGWNIGLVDGGLTLAQMSAAFVASAEFSSTYGSLTNTQFLDQLYLNVLSRPADPVGAAWNLNLLDTNAVDRPGMLAAYSESAENQAAVIGQIQDGIWFI